MSYTVAAGLGVLGALLLDLVVLRTRLVTRKVWWASYPIVLVAQLISNGVLTGRGIVRYNPGAILGLRVVHAPVEDLAFGFALVLTALSVWVWLGDRGIDGPPRSAGQGNCRRADQSKNAQASRGDHPPGGLPDGVAPRRLRGGTRGRGLGGGHPLI